MAAHVSVIGQASNTDDGWLSELWEILERELGVPPGVVLGLAALVVTGLVMLGYVNDLQMNRRRRRLAETNALGDDNQTAEMQPDP